LFLDLSSQFSNLHLLLSVHNSIICFLVVLLVDFPQVYCQILGLLFFYSRGTDS
jgi:hypothetical protein